MELFCLITLLYGSYSINMGKIAHVHNPIRYVKVNTNVKTSSTISSTISNAEEPKELDVRLTNYPQGRLQLYTGHRWTTVCGHYFWDNDEGAKTACLKLGYEGGVIHKVTTGLILDDTDVWYSGGCNAGEAIGQCTGGIEEQCRNNRINCGGCSRGTDADVEVECLGQRAKELDVRLTNYPQGRLQLYTGHRWTTVCGHYFWDNDEGAKTACLKLGYEGGVIHKVTTGLILDTDVWYSGGCNAGEAIGQCTGGIEEQCRNNRINCGGCNRGTDADVEVECLGQRVVPDAVVPDLVVPDAHTEVGAFCGLKHSFIKAYLTPPEPVKKFIAFAFGVTFDIGLLNNSVSETCAELGATIGDVEMAWVGLAPPGFTELDPTMLATAHEIVTGAEATKQENHEKCVLRGEDEDTCTEKEKEDETEGGFSSMYAAIPMPLCMAVRPCDNNGENLFLEWTFGIRFGEGLTIFASVPPAPPVEISLIQLTYSSSGHLTTNAADESYPALLDVVPHTSWGMHVFLEVGISLPMVAVDSQPKFTLEGTGGLGVLAKVTLQNGKELRSPAQLFSYFLESGGDLNKLAAKVRAGDSSFQSVEFELNIMLKGTLSFSFGSLQPTEKSGDDEDATNMISVNAASRNVIQVRLDRDGHSMFQFWSSFQADMRLTDILKTIPVLEKIVPAVDVAVLVRAYGRIMESGETDLIIALKLSVTINCGFIKEIVSVWDDLLATVPAPDGLRNLINALDEFLDAVCGKEQSIGMQFRIVNKTVDKYETFLAFNEHKLRVSDLPYCDATDGIPPSTLSFENAHSRTSARCSSNADCQVFLDWDEFNPYKTGQYTGTKGYCLFDPTFKTSLGCLGRCVKKIAPGGSCSAERLNSPIPDTGLLDEATNTLLGLDDACQSGHCTCGVCTELGGGYVPNEGSCQFSNQCASGWCEGHLLESAFCDGTCKPKRQNGVEAFWHTGRHWGASCESGLQRCGTCVPAEGNGHLIDGKPCRLPEQCQSGWCEVYATEIVGCGGTCEPKREDGMEAWRGQSRHWEGSCKSGTHRCGTCGGDYNVPNGKACRFSYHCQSGWCEVYGTEMVGCGGTCEAKIEDGMEAWRGAHRHWEESCKSGTHRCGTCGGDWNVPNGKPCRFSHHCQSGWCEVYASEQIACAGTCERKRRNGEEAWHGTHRHWEESCESGDHRCGTCVSGDWQVPNGNRCRFSSHCSSGWCEGSSWDASKCNAHCQPKKDDGHWSYEGWDSSCHSGREQCGTCVSGDRQIPNGHSCKWHADCQSNHCRGGYLCSATCV